MGGENSGRRPDTIRRRRVASLYARGLSLAEVGARLGCTRQTAHRLLRAAGVSARREVPALCAGCGPVVARVRPIPPAGGLLLPSLPGRPARRLEDCL